MSSAQASPSLQTHKPFHGEPAIGPDNRSHNRQVGAVDVRLARPLFCVFKYSTTAMSVESLYSSVTVLAVAESDSKVSVQHSTAQSLKAKNQYWQLQVQERLKRERE